jgi:hypothetical protein
MAAQLWPDDALPGANGGPAFPNECATTVHGRAGMTLRDYFATHCDICDMDAIASPAGEAVLGTKCPATPIVHPDYHWLAGPRGRVERYHGVRVTLRSDDGAVSVLPLAALSWEPHPVTMAMEELSAAGVDNPSRRDAYVWMLARNASSGRDQCAQLMA